MIVYVLKEHNIKNALFQLVYFSAFSIYVVFNNPWVLSSIYVGGGGVFSSLFSKKNISWIQTSQLWDDIEK